MKQFRFHVEDPENLDQDQPPLSELREISILKSLKHHNIVNLLDIAVDVKEPRDVYMVMEYCEQVGPPL